MSSLNDILASQDALVREAALALPHEFSRCTYNMGYIRQAVYLCLTCATPRGICSSCSIACHTDHEQIELFPKRYFRCDCPTTAIPHTCTLHKATGDVNTGNEYGQNFRGLFCRCARPYDPKTEQETMIQCLACEDWFHESCLNLRDRPSSREPSPDLPGPGDGATHNEDDRSDASSSGLPPSLITADDYESFVCAACVSKVPILRRYAGTEGVIMVVRDEERGTWRIIGREHSETSLDNCDELLLDGTNSQSGANKRPRSCSASQGDEPEAKRTRVSTSSPCLVPATNRLVQAILDKNEQVSGSKNLTHEGTSDIFLTDGFRERWCRCERCLPLLQAHPYLLEEEDTYEPPEDPDSGLSLEELGARALERLPRDQAIDGIHAFNNMRDHLLEYLRPFAQQGKIVEEADVTRFFETLKEKRQQVN